MKEVKSINKNKQNCAKKSKTPHAGLDLRANIDKSIMLNPLERTIIPTGLFIELPSEFEAQVRPRSGLAHTHGITVLNTPGTIDADYRGEIKVILVNLSGEPFTINDGERIAQMVITKHEVASLIEVNELSESDRGDGGFGSTGK